MIKAFSIVKLIHSQCQKIRKIEKSTKKLHNDHNITTQKLLFTFVVVSSRLYPTQVYTNIFLNENGTI